LASEDDVQRFYTEAQTAANLRHPNIVAIHEVGRHEGQHYFSMDFVEGSSLAELVKENPAPPAQAAQYVQTIAEAIHYAHQHGTLHRDLKPANVLIDEFGQPRVTDFGLAKRIDRQGGRTATGAVLGTPSYMPPEQASGQRGLLSPASDVYSLGAILYELVTGRPPFRAATLLDTLLQVLEAEPAPPRLLNPGVSRDLETIILKSLAKEPARRYASAQALADDLKAFREGRPIKARRPTWPEQAGRWLRKQRRSVLLAAATAGVSVLLVIGAIFGWQWYRARHEGSLLLTTDSLAFEAEVLNERDEPVLPPFTVPTRQPVALPEGSYRLRLSAAEHLSETYQLLVEQGLQRDFEFGSGARQLWEPLEVTEGFEVVELDGRSDVILLTAKGLRRVNGATGKDVWPGGERSLAKKDQAAIAAVGDYDWSQVHAPGWFDVNCPVPEAFHPSLTRPCLVRPARDLAGNGSADLVWASRTGPYLMAVSSKDGSVRWWFQTQRFHGHRGRGFVRQRDRIIRLNNGVMCPPVVANVEGDGKPGLVAVFGHQKNPPGPQRVEAISGRTGRSLWDFAFDLAKVVGGESHYAAVVTWESKQEIVVVVAGTRLVGLDVRTGKVVWPVRDLGIMPVAKPIFADLSGTGQLALLLLDVQGPFSGNKQLMVRAVSLSGQLRWEHRVAYNYSSALVGALLVVDLDGDGKPEIGVLVHEPNKVPGFLESDVLFAPGQSACDL
jgi:hypothetical protein